MSKRIEIAASIAAGKSTLCEGLRKAGFEIIPERLEENHYLKRQYSNGAARSFDVMMAFILSKASAIATHEGKGQWVVADYAMIAEYAYNDIHLKNSPEGHNICQETLDLKRQQIGEPDILIILDCPVEEQIRRIKARGRDFEQGITADYLKVLNDALDRHLAFEVKSGTRVTRIDTLAHDLRDPAVIARIIEAIDSPPRGKKAIPSLSP